MSRPESSIQAGPNTQSNMGSREFKYEQLHVTFCLDIQEQGHLRGKLSQQ